MRERDGDRRKYKTEDKEAGYVDNGQITKGLKDQVKACKLNSPREECQAQLYRQLRYGLMCLMETT